MKLTNYTCDTCGLELDRPAYTLSENSSGGKHFCGIACLTKHLSLKSSAMGLDDVLAEWRKFGEALRREDREKFEEMLLAAGPIAKKLVSSAGEAVSPTEALFMAVLLVIRARSPSPPPSPTW